MYVTVDEMVVRYPLNVLAQLSNDTNGATLDNAVLEALITEADSIVDSYVRTRYTLPLTTVPEGIKRAVANITYYNLHRRRSDAPPQGVVDEYNRTLEYLTKVQSGAVTLFDGVAAPPFVVSNKTRAEKQMAELTRLMP